MKSNSAIVPPSKKVRRVLVVDDEKSIRTTLSVFLQNEGYEVNVAKDAEQALKQLLAGAWDVVVTDIVLPGLSGVELLKTIRDATPDVQVIMMTGAPTVGTAAEGIRAGARDYLAKPVSKDAILRSVATAVQIKKMLEERRALEQQNRRYQENLEAMVEGRTEELRLALDGTIHAMAAVVESRDPYTSGHQRRVAELARSIALERGLAEHRVLAVYYAGVVHDLGKVSVPLEILNTPAKLCDHAMGIIRKHVTTGYDILKRINFPWPIADIVHQHHERCDGSGYPQGLRGSAICDEACILAVADVVEAMASHRPYRPALGLEAALNEITERRASLYDADVVDACVRLFREKGFKFTG